MTSVEAFAGDFSSVLAREPLVLTGGSLFERMRRNPNVRFDPSIKHASLIYHDPSREELAAAHREYIAVAVRHELPMIVAASTWRASHERMAQSAFSGEPVNQDNIHFARELADSSSTERAPLFVAGVLGCRGDAYKPEMALSADAAASFHAFQVGALAEGEPDFLMAATLPALSEARGIARCLDESGMPYLLSFVVRDVGTLLDGAPLAEALDTIDTERQRAPIGYMVNCVHPEVLARCLDAAGGAVTKRIIGLRANTATLGPEELGDADELITQPPEDLAASMRGVQSRGLRILGGCCGTDSRHIESIAAQCKEAP